MDRDGAAVRADWRRLPEGVRRLGRCDVLVTSVTLQFLGDSVTAAALLSALSDLISRLYLSGVVFTLSRLNHVPVTGSCTDLTQCHIMGTTLARMGTHCGVWGRAEAARRFVAF